MTPEEPHDQPQAPKDEPQDQPTKQPETPKKKTISAIAYQDTYISFDQLRAYPPEGCECCNETHYHARNGASVTTMDGKTVQDPFKNCGFGKVSEKPVLQIEVDE